MAYKSLSINLLKKKSGQIDQFIDWGLTIGKAIVIITLTISLGALIYRFTLDRKHSDLTSQIRDKQADVKLQEKEEAIYRNLQSRITAISGTQSYAKKSAENFLAIMPIVPSGIVYTDVSFSENVIKIQARADSTPAFQSLITAIRKLPFIESVSIDNLEYKSASSVIKLSLSATLHSQKIPIKL